MTSVAAGLLVDLCGLGLCGVVLRPVGKGAGAFAAAIYIFVTAGILIWARPFWKAIGGAFVCFSLVVGWWLSLHASNDSQLAARRQ